MITRNTIIVAIGAVVIIIVGAAIFSVLNNSSVPSTPGTATQEGGLPPIAGGVAPNQAPTSAFIGETTPATGRGTSNNSGNGFLPGTPSPSSSGSHTGSSSGSKSGQVAITAKLGAGGTRTFSVVPTAHDASGDYFFSTSTAIYDIAFFPDGGFIITLADSSNLNLARQKAENAFLNILGIKNKTRTSPACALTVSLGIPRGVSEKAYGNDNAAGVDYGLSFCDNSKLLPS